VGGLKARASGERRKQRSEKYGGGERAEMEQQIVAFRTSVTAIACEGLLS
jgi:hypothetical protein